MNDAKRFEITNRETAAKSQFKDKEKDVKTRVKSREDTVRTILDEPKPDSDA